MPSPLEDLFRPSQTPRPRRTPQPGSSLPSGKTLEDLFKEHAGEPPPPGIEDKYTPEQIQKLLKQGKIHKYWVGRYGTLVPEKEEKLEEREQWDWVMSHPKMKLGTPYGKGLYSLPGEPTPEYLKYLRKWDPNAFATPTPTPTPPMDPRYLHLPIELREFLDDYFTLSDHFRRSLITPYAIPIYGGGGARKGKK